MAPWVYEFGPFRLEVGPRTLLHQGESVALTPKAFDTLLVLVENRHRAVSKAELMALLWPDRAVEEANLTQNVFTLRRTLGDDPEAPRYIATLPRHGYRFIADVREARPEAPRQSPRARLSPATWAAALLVVAAVLGLRAATRRGPAASDGGRIESLAVLPLDNLTGDLGNDYLADGLTEALITDLARVPSLRVISRTSAMTYKGTRKPLPEIARSLGVEAVVEGSLLTAGLRPRITVQLIHARTDQHLWAETYELARGDVLAVPGEIARQVAQRLGVPLGAQEQAALGRSRPTRPEVHEAYLKGRHFWNKRSPEGLQKALALFEDARRLDPGFAPAEAGLAETHALLANYGVVPPREAFPRARDAATRALALDPGLVEAHAALGFVRLHYDLDWPGAESALSKALELNPSHVTARQWHAEWLSTAGRHLEALAEIRTAREIDPLSLVVHTNVARLLYFARRYGEAEAEARKATELDPEFRWAWIFRGLALTRMGRAEEALADARRLETPDLAVHALATLGREAEARRTLDEIAARYGPTQPYLTACVLATLGDTAAALAALEKAFERRDSLLVFAGVDPELDPLRPDARFQALVRRIGVPVR
ncbi:MAG: winged helix-turn-helix domain-containing protein [Acidobacteria bacterium]|nr:winged helix-turn-helix domain-containing protein [Acidobacteriota bacterium]